MEKNEIRGYEPLVEELKQLIHKKQYHVLKVINAETINLYWEIGEEIYKQQQEKGWGKYYKILAVLFGFGILLRIPWSKGIFSSKFVENAELLFNISSFRKTRTNGARN